MTKHQKKVRIGTFSQASLLGQFLIYVKLNAKQVIQNHISKEDRYLFAFNELSGYLGKSEH